MHCRIITKTIYSSYNDIKLPHKKTINYKNNQQKHKKQPNLNTATKNCSITRRRQKKKSTKNKSKMFKIVLAAAPAT